MQSLLNMCFEHVLELNPHELSGTPWRVSQLLEARRHCHALCGVAHLASLRTLDTKFFKAYTAVYAPELGLRPPTFSEVQAADKQNWKDIFNLVDVEGWPMEDSLHELSTVRSDVGTLLQARPRSSAP